MKEASCLQLFKARYWVPISSSAAPVLAELNLPKLIARDGLWVLKEPQYERFFSPTDEKLRGPPSGKAEPDMVALGTLYQSYRSPAKSFAHLPPWGSARL